MAIGVNCACIEGLVPHVQAVKTAVSPVVSLRMQCVRVCVVNDTTKTIPCSSFLCSEEHMFTKEVEYVVGIHDTLMNMHLYMHIHSIHGNSQSP